MPQKEKWEMTNEEKLAKARELKAEGTGKFKEKSWALAALAYDDAASYMEELINAENTTEDENIEGVALYTSSLGNAAQCYINMADYSSAISNSSKVLEKEPENVKALYRRGLSRVRIGMLGEAKADLLAAFKLDPNNKAVKQEINKLKAAVADAKEKEKKTFGGMFNKVSMYTDKADNVVVHSGDNPFVFFDVGRGKWRKGTCRHGVVC
jgi:tetratricopeptide (TPR) repeat protein